ncbi:MAG: hypothetical protein O2887_15415 [Bacteroidetes bacterium]|nr:hypothetical protein [Bacteroidota bacterium]MDA1121852.1 hypothetical protein [Bacteroidota bacterium]
MESSFSNFVAQAQKYGQVASIFFFCLGIITVLFYLIRLSIKGSQVKKYEFALGYEVKYLWYSFLAITIA